MKKIEFKMETMCIPTFNFDAEFTDILQEIKQPTVNKESELLLLFEKTNRLRALSLQAFTFNVGMPPHDYYTNFMNGCIKNQEEFEIFNERIKKINFLKEVIRHRREELKCAKTSKI